MVIPLQKRRKLQKRNWLTEVVWLYFFGILICYIVKRNIVIYYFKISTTIKCNMTKNCKKKKYLIY